MKSLLLAFIMSLNIAIATLGVFLVSIQFEPLELKKCAIIAVSFIMLSYIPSAQGFSIDRALKMAKERFGFSSMCLLVIFGITLWK